MKYKIEREIAELRWLMNKLDKMKNDSGRAKQTPGTRVETSRQNQISQFSLGLRLSPVVEHGDESARREYIHKR
jgi:hypothetical protein